MTKKNILITGAGSGVGKGLALGLAKEGHHLVVTDLQSASAQAVASSITEAGGSAQALALDVTDEACIHAALGKLDHEVDVLVNNAGMQYVSRLEDFPQQKWDQLIDIMLNGACRMTRASLKGMRHQHHGRIINLGSIHSIVASPFKSAYVAAKHGLLGFSKTIALETADTDITINTICPSYLKTPLVEKQINRQAKEHGLSEQEVISEIMLKPMPKGTFIEIDEVLGTILFLMSPAARNITGQTITIDGGWTIQ